MSARFHCSTLGRRLGQGGLAALVALSVTACKDETPAPATDVVPLDSVRGAGLTSLAALPGMPKTVQFRGVQAYQQAAKNRFAICGLVSAFADDANIFVPFVTVATQTSPPDAKPPRYEFDTHVGTTTTEASRVYAALVANCWAGGGLAPGRAPSLPPLPDNIRDPHAPDLAAAPVSAGKANARVAGQTASDGSVTIRQSANVHATPGGSTIRTAIGGTTLHVFATAPNGWYQVGDTAPFGWVHESMVSR